MLLLDPTILLKPGVFSHSFFQISGFFHSLSTLNNSKKKMPTLYDSFSVHERMQGKIDFKSWPSNNSTEKLEVWILCKRTRNFVAYIASEGENRSLGSKQY